MSTTAPAATGRVSLLKRPAASSRVSLLKGPAPYRVCGPAVLGPCAPVLKEAGSLREAEACLRRLERQGVPALAWEMREGRTFRVAAANEPGLERRFRLGGAAYRAA